MPDGEDSDDAVSFDELIDHSVRADAQRPKPAKSSTKRTARLRLTLQQAQRFLDRIREWPVQGKDVPAGSSGEVDACQLPATTLSELAS